ncbi:MAG TPA: DUF4249 family protein [Bacteroidales bacterium]|nr:DUF4249 family protein [Bacteroidales bacterium]
MKTNLLYTLSIFIGALMLLHSCTEDFNPDLDTTYTRLVVDGGISTDTTVHTVTLLRSGDALNKQAKEYISDAIVTISDGTTVYPLAESSSKPGVYETQPNVYGVPGKTYVLNIANVDIDKNGVFENYTASSVLKDINPIDSIKVVGQEFTSRQKGWHINMFSRDIGGKSFYCVKAYKNNILISDSLKEYGISDNVGFEGTYYPGISVYYLDNDKEDERVEVGDVITLELDGITEEYYNFLKGSITESSPKDPIFSGPSANVITNISPSDKAVGFFKAYSIRKKTSIYNGEMID